MASKRLAKLELKILAVYFCEPASIEDGMVTLKFADEGVF